MTPGSLEGKRETSLPSSIPDSRASSLTSLSFISPGSSFLTYQVSSGLTLGSSLSILPSSHTGSCQSIHVDSPVQSKPQSNTGPQENKAEDSEGDGAKASDQVAEEKQPAQGLVPLQGSPQKTQM